jgi:hypothetical protein
MIALLRWPFLLAFTTRRSWRFDRQKSPDELTIKSYFEPLVEPLSDIEDREGSETRDWEKQVVHY